MRDFTFLDRPWFQFSLAVLIGVLLGVLGPFGSFGRLGLEQRVFQWVVLVVLNWGLVLLAGQAVRALPNGKSLPSAGQGLIAALAAAIPGAAATSALVGRWGWWPESGPLPFAEMLLYVAAINVAISVPLRIILHFRAAQATSATEVPFEPGEVRFLRRLPPRLGRDLLAVEAEDHYLRVHTALGSDLILMRLSDAEAELAGLEGARTHRSWWVARAAVIRAERQGQTARLDLINGMSVPVSRSNIAALKAAGWF